MTWINSILPAADTLGFIRSKESPHVSPGHRLRYCGNEGTDKMPALRKVLAQSLARDPERKVGDRVLQLRGESVQKLSITISSVRSMVLLMLLGQKMSRFGIYTVLYTSAASAGICRFWR